MKKSALILLTLSCWLLTTMLAGCQNLTLYKDTRVIMGTFVEVISPEKQASGLVFAEFKRIENLLSKYNPESEVSKLNKTGKLKVSPETFYIIKRSKEFSQASNGAFDITVGPLMDLWGFTNKNYRVPKEVQIKDTLKLIGSEKIILREEDNVVEFMLPGMKIDLGAIGKGYALDCAIDKLKKKGITSCLINAGGQVYCLGNKFCQPWKIGVRGTGSSGVLAVFALKDQSASTSGDYEQFFLQDGCRYSHIMNPSTGFPADSKISSVTVVAASGLEADALSTAVFVLGKVKGRVLVKKYPQAEIKVIQ